MHSHTHDASVDRRTFLKAGALGTVAAATGAGTPARAAEPPPLQETAFRTLGRTGLRVSSVAIGTFLTTEPAVMRVAFDHGINFLDTARTYHDGNNEAYVGEALKGRRDKVYVSTKVVLGSKKAMMRSIDTSLSKLGTDHVDILFLHHLASRDEVLNEVAREVLVEARTQGKTRFVGVSTHKNEVEVLDTVIDDPDKLYDAAMVVYNFQSAEALKTAIARAAQAGVGIVAMKTQAGGYDTKELGDISPHQAALKWVLRDSNVATTVPSMVNLDQIRENTAVMRMGLKLSRVDQRILERYAQAIAPYYCHRCGACESTCPYGVDIPTINRCLMYVEGYGNHELARATHAGLCRSVSAFRCTDCPSCVARCARSIALPEQLRRAQTFLT